MPFTHLYYANVHEWDIVSLKKSLAKEEQERIEGIKHFPTLARKVVSRALLRRILHDNYEIKKDRLVFDYNERGKPFLRYDPHLYFNGSQSHDLVMIGISQHPIGVDIEFTNPLPDENAVAKCFFSQEEHACYLKLREVTPNAFYQFWTLKEATIKALGKGLWEARQVPAITLQETQVALRTGFDIHQDWTHAFPHVNPDYCSCLAVLSDSVDIRVQFLKPNEHSVDYLTHT